MYENRIKTHLYLSKRHPTDNWKKRKTKQKQHPANKKTTQQRQTPTAYYSRILQLHGVECGGNPEND